MRPVIDRSSARETAMRVACCSVARRLLNEFGIEVGSHVVRIGDVGFDEPEEWADRRNALIEEGGGASALYETADESATRMIDDGMTERCVEHIDQTKKDRDSLGGVYEVVVTGVPPGLGSYVHWDRRLDGQLVQAICSIQAQKAAEVGDGFFNAHRPGSQVHDPIEPREDGAQAYPRRTNHAGGTEGGTTTGMPLVVRGYMKPIPTLIKPLDSRPPSPTPWPTRSCGSTGATPCPRSGATLRPTAPPRTSRTGPWTARLRRCGRTPNHVSE
jgi:chorismate synthase